VLPNSERTNTVDPKANIDEQRTLAAALLDTTAAGAISQRPDIEDDVQRLCEVVLALDQWRSTGGFDPYQVSPSRRIDKARAWDAIEETLTRNARGESHAAAADVCAVGSVADPAVTRSTTREENTSCDSPCPRAHPRPQRPTRTRPRSRCARAAARAGTR
jgi:hypothetical protein